MIWTLPVQIFVPEHIDNEEEDCIGTYCAFRAVRFRASDSAIDLVLRLSID